MHFVYNVSIILLVIIVSVTSESRCNIHSTILRQLEREGFHLEIHSLIELVVDVETAPLWENCTLLLREHISDAFFANPDQLSELSRSVLFPSCTNEPVDTEAPQHLAHPHLAYIYSPVHRSQNLIYSHVKFPLHLRYQKPKPRGGYSSAVLSSPSLLFRCPEEIGCKNLTKIKAPCYFCGTAVCEWLKLPYKTNAYNFTVPVPVGNLDHYPYIMVLTYLLTFGACFLVLVSLVG